VFQNASSRQRTNRKDTGNWKGKPNDHEEKGDRGREGERGVATAMIKQKKQQQIRWKQNDLSMHSGEQDGD
jgi:hypothetical protein